MAQHPPEAVERLEKSRMPARLDLIQSISGLALAVFMWTHLVLVASILAGKDAMLWVTHLMEASFLKPDEPGGYPIIPAIIALGVFALFMLHAVLAMRKFPSSWRQHRIFRSQMKMMHHTDTNQWYLQAVTGFVMMFIGSVHIYIMFTQADNIGPYASADRFVTGMLWPLYLVLLFCVELHAAVGVYRLAVKWGVFDGRDPTLTRKRLKLAKNGMSAFFLVLGVLTFAAYVKIGIEHRDHAGERYRAESTVEGVSTALGEVEP
ncbi:MAG: fumarate reductase cytochrome b subunit [Myxococcota bacterium]